MQTTFLPLATTDLISWIAGVLFIVLAIVLVTWRVRAKRRRESPLKGQAAPKLPPIHEGALDAAAAATPTDELIARETAREESAIVERAPASDAPADLAAREADSIPQDSSVPPHTTEEIQRREPKALASALQNTRGSFFGRIKNIFSAKPQITAGELDDLEEILYTSDLGPQTVQRLLSAVETKLRADGGSGFEAVRSALKTEMIDIFDGLNGGQDSRDIDGSAGGLLASAIDPAMPGSEYIEGLERLQIWNRKPAVLMIVGVNGAGKTTTIGKLARRIAQSGRKVLVAAGDTFRAAAGDQLKVWTERAQVEIFSPENVSDPSAVAYQAIERGLRDSCDVVIIDTAGRLHTQKNLMEELKKMKRVMTKLIPDAPHEVLLVLDANSGQNALIQAREFNQALDVTGVVLTKLDGTAKGGVAVGLACELRLPIKLIGVGEGIEDLRRFSSREFVDSII
jgi:fused signal recognition particle receptor